jgi:hypothetical protein
VSQFVRDEVEAALGSAVLIMCTSGKEGLAANATHDCQGLYPFLRTSPCTSSLAIDR